MKVHELITWLSMNCKGSDDVTLDHEDMIAGDLQWGWKGNLNICSLGPSQRVLERLEDETSNRNRFTNTPHTSPDQ